MEDDGSVTLDDKKEIYFNPRPPHGGRQSVPATYDTSTVISIHVLRMEDDISARL